MKVEELYREMSTRDSYLAHLQQADNEDYVVMVEQEGELHHIERIRWEHSLKTMVLELG